MSEGGKFERIPWPTLLRWSDQACCVGLFTAALAWMGATWIYWGGLRGQLIDIDRAAPRPVHFQLDINQADWDEWLVLPGIGEQLARRIVQTRGNYGRFAEHEDLLHVPGIGPRTLERMRPYLLPVEASGAAGATEAPVRDAGTIP